MATVFKRTEIFRKQKSKHELSTAQRCELGMIVFLAYVKIKPPNVALQRALFINEKGTFNVRDYPRSFIPEIDSIVAQYYQSIQPPEPKLRKRIPVRNPLNYKNG